MPLPVRMMARGAAVVALLTIGSGKALAQAEAVFGLVGGMIAAAQAQAAAQAWAQQPALQQYCVDRGLSRQGVSLERLIRAGVGPTDPRLNSLFSQCARLDPRQLKSGYRCTIVDETGSLVPSTCDQKLARQDGGGRTQILDARAAIDLYFSNGTYLVVDVETETGRSQRHAHVLGLRRIAELAQLRGQAERFGGSRSDMVRDQTDRLVRRIAAASNPASPPSETLVATLRRDVEALPDLERADLSRMSALDRLTSVKRMVEGRAANLPQNLKDEIARLDADFAALSAPPVAQPVRSEPDRQAVGPSFDCGRARSPLERVICSTDALRRLDLEVLQPYYVLRHVAPDQRQSLKDEAVRFGQQVKGECRLPDNARTSQSLVQKAAPCVRAAYTRQRSLWLQRAEREAGPAAREEALRAIDEHVLLQARLQKIGLLPQDDRIDGIYGGGVRTAIATFQAREGLVADGMLSDQVAARLIRREAPSGRSGVDASSNARIADLHRRYLALSSRVDEEEARRRREEAISAKVRTGRFFAQEALTLDVPAALKDRLRAFLAESEETRDGPDPARQARLASQFDELRPAAEQAVTLARAVTSKNRFLVEGALDEILILVNDTGRAPSVVKNLRGDFVFEAGRTRVCQPGGGFGEVAVTRHINARLANWGLGFRFPAERCNARTLAAYDLVLLSRGEVLKTPVADVVALLSAVEANVFSVLVSISADEIRSAQQAEAVMIADIEAGIERETRTGFGVLVLTAATSGVVCQVPGEDREAHEALLGPHLGRISEETKASPTVVVTSADGAFVSAKRGQCGAVYAGVRDLKAISGALARDQIGYRFLPIWMETEQVAAAKEALNERRRRELQQEADRRRRLEDEQRLSDVKASEEAVVKARREAELRQQYGAMARALEGQLAAEMKDFVEGRPSKAGYKYPSVRTWYAARLQDKWELMTVDTELLDYGVSEFKGRTIETAFARTHLKMRNRVLGEYAEHCFVTGFIADKEFDMDREPFEAPCGDADRLLSEYRQGQRFASRWLVE